MKIILIILITITNLNADVYFSSKQIAVKRTIERLYNKKVFCDLDLDYLIGMAWQESSFNPNAVGGIGEIGLFQINLLPLFCLPLFCLIE